MLQQIRCDLHTLANPEKILVYQRFFKTGKGQYGEGDVFIGLTVPNTRKVAKKYSHTSDVDIKRLLQSKIHEERLCGLLILVEQFKKGDERKKKAIFDFYLSCIKYVNNWDLVDLSAPNIVGMYLLDKKDERKILYKLAHSNDLWEKRIAIISTFAFINKGKESADTLKLSERLLNDKHDLIHKAVGWMLREVGKRVSQEDEEKFLKKYYMIMPRTMLRYAIERFEEEKRLSYLKK